MFKPYQAILSIFGVTTGALGFLFMLVIPLRGAEIATVATQPGKVITGTVAIGASRDNTLYESTTGTSSNGIGEYFFVGSTKSGVLRRGVIAFDVAEAVPAEATIVSATLSLNLSRAAGGSAEATAVSIHTLQKDWGEGTSNALDPGGAGNTSATPGDATWLHTFFDTTRWNQPGGDFDDIPLATTLVNQAGRYRWQSTELTDSVLSWYTHPLDNFGWILVGDEANLSTARRFDTRENINPNNQPILHVTYTFTATTTLYLPVIRK